MPRRPVRPVVLVFGENINDARAVASLIESLCPNLDGRVRARPRPTSLQRNASPNKVKAWLDRLAAVVAAWQDPVQCVFVHRDADSPNGARLRQDTMTALRRAGVARAFAAVPTHAIEAWWLHFPSATESLRSGWGGTLDQTPGDVDRNPDPKSELIRRTRRGQRRHAYTEADSPEVADRVASAIRSGEQPSGQSRSFTRFRADVARCCST